MPSRRDHLRAFLIALHLAFITLASVPAPTGEVTERNRRDPDVRAALAPWAGVVVRLGLAEDTDDGVDRLFGAGRALNRTRARLLRPLSPYPRTCGTGQGWRMFGGVVTRAGLLEIHGRDGGHWRPLYVEHTDADWNAALLNQSRIRALRATFGKRRDRAGYRAFAAWIAARALEDPALAAVRIRYQGIHIAPAAVVREAGLPRTAVYWERTVERSGR